jgi:hypothetical protein
MLLALLSGSVPPSTQVALSQRVDGAAAAARCMTVR